MSEPLKKSWLEAGAILYFEKQPDRPFIPRRGESFTSIAVYKADDVDAKLAAETARADRAEAACAEMSTAIEALLSGIAIQPGAKDNIKLMEAVVDGNCAIGAINNRPHPGSRFLDAMREKEAAEKMAQEVGWPGYAQGGNPVSYLYDAYTDLAQIVEGFNEFGEKVWVCREKADDQWFAVCYGTEGDYDTVATGMTKKDADALARLLAWRQKEDRA